MSDKILNNKKIIRAWAMYDWANSVYNLIVTTTFFPVYYIAITTAVFNGEVVNFFGISVINSVLYDYSISFAFLIVLILTPFLSALADIFQNKIFFLNIFSTLGAIACAGLCFFKGPNIELGILAFITATIGYAGSLVFYNAFLPQIASPENQDSVSAKGFIYGYVGSVILQIIGFVILLTKPFNINDAEAIRITFFLVGLWWFCFAQYSILILKKIEQPTYTSKSNITSLIKTTLYTTFNTAKNVFQTPVIVSFLLAFFFYNMGVQTVMIVAIHFGQKVLHIPANNLILTAVAIQFIAIIGSYCLSALSKRIGNLKTLIIVVVMWMGVVFVAYKIQSANQFYVLAVIVGFVMGGIQSMSRSTFSKLKPPNFTNTTAYFGLFDLIEKTTIVFGIFAFGFIESLTHDMRKSVLMLMGFFMMGLIFLLRSKKHL